MRRLEAGPQKYLLLDTHDILRNTERSTDGEPVCVVAVQGEDGSMTLHRGYAANALSAVSLVYSKNVPLFTTRLAPDREDEPVYAAFGTTGEVLLAETFSEVLVPATKKTTAKKES